MEEWIHALTGIEHILIKTGCLVFVFLLIATLIVRKAKDVPANQREYDPHIRRRILPKLALHIHHQFEIDLHSLRQKEPQQSRLPKLSPNSFLETQHEVNDDPAEVLMMKQVVDSKKNRSKN